MNNNRSRRFLDSLQGKLAGKVDEGKLQAIASQVKKSDFEDETKLRQMIQSLATLTGKQLTPEREDKIIQMFRDKEINLQDLSSLNKLLR
ncbi:stage VI sporulation protein F [Brevibacillus panacihumi]|uniref:Stage VI sporulation protein F n=1 Tax=Brevibacillus panacihumi TaxID=497735 RepID=A0A3M8D9W0_9BACL|nr:stage VI sporulation protein F [Brevibacillus panacihumi]RNB84930.1 hypothetical protein EDM58_04435 [Brevibacillus panacihumi]